MLQESFEINFKEGIFFYKYKLFDEVLFILKFDVEILMKKGIYKNWDKVMIKVRENVLNGKLLYDEKMLLFVEDFIFIRIICVILGIFRCFIFQVQFL